MKSEDFKPREAKARFEKMCVMLSQQAFWLSIFEFLEKYKEALSGVQFGLDHRVDGVADLMIAVPRVGADAKKVEKAIKASTSAFSKSRGKIQSLSAWDLIRIAKLVLPGDALATLERREQIFKKALGGELYGLRLSIIEAKELDSVVCDSISHALGARPKTRL